MTEELIGRVMACPHCGRHFSLPHRGASAVSLAMPAAHSPIRVVRPRFTFSCQRCSSILEARGEMSGERGTCPTCGALFIIPRTDPNTGLPLGPAVVEADGQLPTPMHAYATAGDKAPIIRRLASGEQVIVCPRCERHSPVDAHVCATCGMPFTMDGSAAIAQISSGRNGLATASLTVGVVSLLAGCLPGLGLVAIGLGIGGLNRAENRGPDRLGRGMAIAGIVCGTMAVGWILAYL